MMSYLFATYHHSEMLVTIQRREELAVLSPAVVVPLRLNVPGNVANVLEL
jgi:hypothetical protein